MGNHNTITYDISIKAAKQAKQRFELTNGCGQGSAAKIREPSSLDNKDGMSCSGKVDRFIAPESQLHLTFRIIDQRDIPFPKLSLRCSRGDVLHFADFVNNTDNVCAERRGRLNITDACLTKKVCSSKKKFILIGVRTSSNDRALSVSIHNSLREINQN